MKLFDRAQKGSRDSDTVLAMISLWIKLEERNFTRPNDRKDGPKFTKMGRLKWLGSLKITGNDIV